MGVQPARPPVGVAQGHLTAVGNNTGLATDDGAKASLETGLELAGHHGVMVTWNTKGVLIHLDNISSVKFKGKRLQFIEHECKNRSIEVMV